VGVRFLASNQQDCPISSSKALFFSLRGAVSASHPQKKDFFLDLEQPD
jgi:hypothetical protein